MSFSCTIKVEGKDVTLFQKGPIHCQLFGLGPNSPGDTDAPYRLSEFRQVVQNCVYGDRLKEAAQDAFVLLQEMAKANLQSLDPPQHCETCTCDATHRITPNGWCAEDLEAILAIDPDTITYLHGGW